MQLDRMAKEFWGDATGRTGCRVIEGSEALRGGPPYGLCIKLLLNPFVQIASRTVLDEYERIPAPSRHWSASRNDQWRAFAGATYAKRPSR